MERVVLHACCGPCLLEPLDALRAEGFEPLVVYANPNIHPRAEYERRRDVLVEYAASVGAEVVEVPYAPVLWLEATAGLWRTPAERCRACWRLRLALAARVAAERGIDALATTLTVSPYQDAAALDEVAREVAEQAGLAYVGRDFRSRYQDAVRRSKELGMYRQKYCGCMLSEWEAAKARADRDARRAKEKGGAP
ncbi:epoxyqueuosine reductase QueH [Coriobacteriia bacterium Es71-Z0120]|uniref:epoxyqueuosine reductase QueH n=1 Tax=Parvivirga hydrogeniphila TaxID=2939460 RepID=UPI002260FEDB|nr:epoxyqueuosine reductase QueH [Parvivirga hydrogeniphila]MCL4079201.1 epoxyqueuosine reductase QueH [Parvivirga hydrogeniphila]